MSEYVESFNVTLFNKNWDYLSSYDYNSEFLYNLDNIIPDNRNNPKPESFNIKLTFDFYKLIDCDYDGSIFLKERRIIWYSKTHQYKLLENLYEFTLHKNKNQIYLICEFNNINFGFRASYEELYGSTEWNDIIAYDPSN